MKKIFEEYGMSLAILMGTVVIVSIYTVGMDIIQKALNNISCVHV